MPLSLQRIQELLRDQERTLPGKRMQEQKDNESISSTPLTADQRRKILLRPIPPTMYNCPISEPRTTIVPYNWLPKRVQDKVDLSKARVFADHASSIDNDDADDNDDDDNVIVEIPIAWMDAEEVTEKISLVADSLAGQRRQGNLRDKLTEYTRGSRLQQPFRPGGLGPSAATVAADNHKKGNHDMNSSNSIEEIQRHQKVLEQDTVESWRQGILLTAPPGVSFQVGLSWESLHGEPLDALTERTTKEKEDITNDMIPLVEQVTTIQPPRTMSVPLFSKSYFDDDSLFGSSSSSDGSSSDEDEDNEEKVDAEKKNEDAMVEVTVPTTIATTTASQGGERGVDDAGEDIDTLLAELTLDPMKSKKKIDLPTNPLDLAERQARDQLNSTRKEWANTKYLPIRDFDALIPNPALVYPFTLDDFQQQAIARLERNESVFVAAHTSAGKTVVAEYAVALAMRRATRCVYTSPIKALSNQKFRDFSLKFGAKNVGLVTGDMQINADDSTCLIMTTEILRSMLYRGADLIRDIEYVVFDEVHYVNDTERGVVWEEVIIMLPSYVNLIFLSATTPNTLEFSDWIGRTKRKPVHVVKTNYRPVPLSFHLWTGNKLHKIMEGKSGFLPKGYREAENALLPASAKKDPNKKGDTKTLSKPPMGSKTLMWQAQGGKNQWMSLVRFLDREELTPTVVFSFSKKKCEEIAYMLQSLDLNTAKERSAVQGFVIQAVSRLSHKDASLPQVMMVSEMVQRGIGVHHGGLLPILKECVEILFSRNLIKVLFATETFAMGVNMPARSVVFNSIRKHDGSQFRVLEPGELTQMAGRAGRRGLDDVGTVILCCFGEKPPPEQTLKHMLTGSSTRLQSQFRLTYNMILNLLRIEAISVEAMIQRSFSEFATQRALTANDYPQLLAKGRKTLVKLDESLKAEGSVVGAEDINDYFKVCRDLLVCHKEILDHLLQSEPEAFEEDIFVPGRVVILSSVRELEVARRPAIVLRSGSGIKSSSTTPSKAETSASAEHELVCLILLPEGREISSSDKEKQPFTIGYVGKSNHRDYAIRKVTLGQVLAVCSRKQKINTKELLKEDTTRTNHPGMRSGGFGISSRERDDPFAGMMAVGKKGGGGGASAVPRAIAAEDSISKVIQALVESEHEEINGDGVALIDLKPFIQRGEDLFYFRGICETIEILVDKMRSFSAHRHPSLEKYYRDIEKRETLRTKVDALQHALSNESLALFPDFMQRKQVLARLGYIDETETVRVKGRCACEVNTTESLIATEMVFEGILNDLKPEEIVACLSAMVFQEKSESELDSELPETLLECCQKMQMIATTLGQIQKDCGLKVDPNEYRDSSLKFGMVHVVYEWAIGVSFKNICELTDVQEGSIVRCITRLDELCREIRNCARVVGNPTLYRKMETASAAIKRDIVFASSLYVN